jgi:hypothetical protein
MLVNRFSLFIKLEYVGLVDYAGSTLYHMLSTAYSLCCHEHIGFALVGVSKRLLRYRYQIDRGEGVVVCL